MAFQFTWKFTFSDGEKVVERHDFVKSRENSGDPDFARLMGKCFLDTLNGVIGNRKDLAKWITEEGVPVDKPFMVFPPERIVKVVNKLDKKVEKAKKKVK